MLGKLKFNAFDDSIHKNQANRKSNHTKRLQLMHLLFSESLRRPRIVLSILSSSFTFFLFPIFSTKTKYYPSFIQKESESQIIRDTIVLIDNNSSKLVTWQIEETISKPYFKYSHKKILRKQTRRDK